MVAGAPLTESDKTSILADTKAFIGDGTISAPAVRRRVKKSLVVPYAATCDWLHDLQFMLQGVGCGGFQKFHNVYILDDLGLDAWVKGGVCDPSKVALLLRLPAPACLSLALDQEQKQVTARGVMDGVVVKITNEVFDDYSHRSHNDIDIGIRRAGMKTSQ